MVSMRQLRYFVEIVEAGNYSLAAERLYIAQSALSRQIKELETTVQAQLLTRGARRVELTPAGRTFYDGAKRLLFNLNETLVRTQHADRGEQALVRLLHSSSVPLDPVLMGRIQAFLDANEGVSLEISQLTSEHQGDDIEQGSGDVGLARLPVQHRHPGVRIEELLTEPLMLAVPARHRLARRKKVAVADLRDERFVCLPHPERGGLGFRVAELCMRNGFFPHAARATSRKTTQLTLIAAGMGVSLLPACMRSIAPAGVRFVPLADEDTSTTVALLHRHDAPALTYELLQALRGTAHGFARPGRRAAS
ncbi:LysR family transcriptional regulator [Bordetella ansorpii]|uniref:LysR family transcriptional regulator n=1 Tax=Bordetella ansorpii TaxID=288768 RepID=A0A157SLV0_9BORD|nr:LysR family transcriptional regulator [Bordetella ansorpii]SAI71448.1 LysR family transcriptional regulator [Bordetella ansorpii]